MAQPGVMNAQLFTSLLKNLCSTSDHIDSWVSGSIESSPMRPLVDFAVAGGFNPSDLFMSMLKQLDVIILPSSQSQSTQSDENIIFGLLHGLHVLWDVYSSQINVDTEHLVRLAGSLIPIAIGPSRRLHRSGVLQPVPVPALHPRFPPRAGRAAHRGRRRRRQRPSREGYGRQAPGGSPGGDRV